MAKKRRTGLIICIAVIFIVLGLLGWFLSHIFEGEKPSISLEPLPQYLSGDETFSLQIGDQKRGLKRVQVVLIQEGRETAVLEEPFPFEGFLNRDGVREYEKTFAIDPPEINLAQGRADLQVRVWDYSRRSGGDGNLSVLEHRMVVDTIPPAVRALSRMHNVNVGGTGLVVYQASSDTAESGVYVGEHFFSGFHAEDASQTGSHVCFFAIPYNAAGRPEVFLWAKDKAGNTSRARFYIHILDKRFRTERVNITDSFLSQVLPYFSFYPMDPDKTDIEKFVQINRELRRENAEVFYDLRDQTSPQRLWEGTWVRLKNAANMARFAEHRIYYYKGEKIDEQDHMGVDLASLANSDVQAANRGRVVFADRNGIYGLTVVLDHGQGLASSYSHLSDITVSVGQEVPIGSTLGHTGQTGLAGGDHLHFGVMVSGVFVNPIEWWDPHWIQDNITRKMELLAEQ
jgi:murein DD-endopeptidase MepM/ murein hydrolase activator NlpD